jgi:hypothetical protein
MVAVQNLRKLLSDGKIKRLPESPNQIEVDLGIISLIALSNSKNTDN